MDVDVRKRKLEANAIPDLRVIFRNMANDAESLYRKNGSINSQELADNYRPEFLKEIRDIMRKTIREFSFDLRDEFGIDSSELDTQFKNAATFFIANQSEQQAKFITETNAKEIASAILQEELKFSTKKSLPEWLIIARNIKVNLLDKRQARSELIAAQVIGMTEGKTRQKEAELINGYWVNGEKLQLKKTWVAILDSKTRPEHVAADFQQVALNQPFLVGGEYLMHPRDPNGSAGNVINCRCIADYSKFGA